MKLVSITHERCGEFDKNEYYIAPDHLSKDDIDRIVDEAQTAYLKAKEEAAKIPRPVDADISYIMQIAADTMTVGQLKAMHNEYSVKYQEWQALERLQAGCFNDYLAKHNIVPVYTYVYEADDDPNVITCNISWGHRHNLNLEY